MAITKDSNGNYQSTGGLGFSTTTTSAPSGYNKTTASGVTGTSSGDVENLENGYVGEGTVEGNTYNLLSTQISELDNQNTVLFNTLEDMEDVINELNDILEKNNLSAWLQEEVGQSLKNKITQNYNGLISLRKNLIEFYDGMVRLCTIAEQNNKL